MKLTEAPQKRYYPALDGLRAIAVIAVFLNHYTFPHLGIERFSWVGVDIFFVLSGFLITGILFDSRDRPHRFRDFYMRRILRILPVYYAFWILLGLLGFYFHWKWEPGHLLYLVHLGNLATFVSFHPQDYNHLMIVRNGIGRHMGTVPYVALGTFWTLCVEEQFYLIWPAVVFSRLSRKSLLNVCMVAVPAILLLRFVLWLWLPKPWLAVGFLYVFTLARVDAFLVGGALALALRGPEAAWLEKRRTALLAAGYSVFALCILYLWLQHGVPLEVVSMPLVSIPGFTLVDLCAAVVIFHAIEPGSAPYRALQWKPLASLGVISYGFYLFHEPFYVAYYSLATRLVGESRSIYVGPILGFVGTLVIATLSYRYLETPFLKLKNRFASNVHRAPTPDLPLVQRKRVPDTMGDGGRRAA